MSNVPVQLIVAAFQDEKTAKQALNVLKDAQREKLIKINNAAVLHKDARGRLHIKETADMGGGRGAVLGGVAGAAIGVIAGPALLVPAAVGALLGGLSAKLRDSGFSDGRLKTLGAHLTPGSSAIVAVVEHTWVDEVKKAMAEAGADLFAEEIGADIGSQLEAGHEEVFTAIASEEGFAVARVAGGEDEIDAAEIVVDDSGLYGARFVATPEGFAVVALEADEEGMTVATIAAAEDEIEDQEAAAEA